MSRIVSLSQARYACITPAPPELLAAHLSGVTPPSLPRSKSSHLSRPNPRFGQVSPPIENILLLSLELSLSSLALPGVPLILLAVSLWGTVLGCV